MGLGQRPDGRQLRCGPHEPDGTLFLETNYITDLAIVANIAIGDGTVLALQWNCLNTTPARRP